MDATLAGRWRKLICFLRETGVSLQSEREEIVGALRTTVEDPQSMYRSGAVIR
jgi:hypothetical protein